MKKTIGTLIVLASLAAATVSADDAAVQSRVDQIKSEFSLNDQQAKRIASILNRAGMSKEEKRTAHMEKRIQRRVERMTRHLALSTDQATQLSDILTQQSAQMRAMHTQVKADITSMLTPEQATKFAAMDERKGKGRKGGKGGWHGKKHGKRGGHGSKCEAH